MGMSLYGFPEQKPTQHCSRPSVLKKKTALQVLPHHCQLSTLWPWWTACAKCRNIPVSASEWLHTWHITGLIRKNWFMLCSQQQPTIHIIIGDYFTDERKQFLSAFFIFNKATIPVTLRNMCTAIPNRVFWATPTSLVCKCFEVVTWITVPDGIYTLDIIGVIYDFMCGIMCFVTYSENVCQKGALVGRIMCTNVAISRSTTVTWLIGIVCSVGADIHSITCDLTPVRSVPWSARLGGSPWFS